MIDQLSTSAAILAEIPWVEDRLKLSREDRYDAVDEALDLIDRAEHAEQDAAVIRLYTAITGRDGPVPSSFLGSLHDRLELLGTGEDKLRAMGVAFADADATLDAIDHLTTVWRRIPPYIAANGIWSDVNEAFFERRVNARRKAVGFKEPCLPRRKVIPPEINSYRDHRRTKRILKQWEVDVGCGSVTMYKTTVRHGEPQVTATDEREWELDFRDTMRKSKRQRPVGNVQTGGRPRSSVHDGDVCRLCSRFKRDCRLIASHSNGLVLIDIGPNGEELAHRADTRQHLDTRDRITQPAMVRQRA